LFREKNVFFREKNVLFRRKDAMRRRNRGLFRPEPRADRRTVAVFRAPRPLG
jgi:hypothetical protein